MNIPELIEKLRDGSNDVLKDIPDERAKAIILKLFRQVSAVVARTQEERVQFPGLGAFRIRKIEKEVKGAKVKRKQVRFMPKSDMKKLAKRKKKRGERRPTE